MLYNQSPAFDNSWSVLNSPSNANCGCTLTATGNQFGQPCCNDLNCQSGFCQCRSPSTLSVCSLAPVGTPCTLNNTCATGVCEAYFCTALVPGQPCVSPTQCDIGFQCALPTNHYAVVYPYVAQQVNVGTNTVCLAPVGTPCSNYSDCLSGYCNHP